MVSRGVDRGTRGVRALRADFGREAVRRVGSAWEYYPETESYGLHIFAKEQPDLNWECELTAGVFRVQDGTSQADVFRRDIVSDRS
jgi:glycosidase